MRIEAISFQTLREIIDNNFPFPPEFGRPFFVLGASQDAWMPFWLKAYARLEHIVLRLKLTYLI
jgi:hypothetical protein